MMNHEDELLTYVHQNAQMGVETTTHLLEMLEDEKFCQELLREQSEYRKIEREAEEISGRPLKDIPTSAKTMSYLMIDFKTLGKRTPGYVSEMMVKGSTNGIIEITKRIRQYEGTTPRAEKLAQELLALEEQNVDNLKGFIS